MKHPKLNDLMTAYATNLNFIRACGQPLGDGPFRCAYLLAKHKHVRSEVDPDGLVPRWVLTESGHDLFNRIMTRQRSLIQKMLFTEGAM
jgi:hypothetical protein